MLDLYDLVIPRLENRKVLRLKPGWLVALTLASLILRIARGQNRFVWNGFQAIRRNAQVDFKQRRRKTRKRARC